MPILMMKEDNAAIVVVHCDHCFGRIETADDGNVEWARIEDGKPGELPRRSGLFFTHKACASAFSKAHPEVNQSMELMLLPIRLGASLEVDFRAAVETAVHLKSLG